MTDRATKGCPEVTFAAGAPLRCHSSILDELLWALWGWLWVLGGAATPEAWLGDLRWQCEECHGWQDPDHGCADDAPELCDDCWAETHGSLQ